MNSPGKIDLGTADTKAKEAFPVPVGLPAHLTLSIVVMKRFLLTSLGPIANFKMLKTGSGVARKTKGFERNQPDGFI